MASPTHHGDSVSGSSWRRTAKALGIGTATAMRLSLSGTMESRPNIQETSPQSLGDGRLAFSGGKDSIVDSNHTDIVQDVVFLVDRCDNLVA
jgi:hypothetical protein